MSAPAQADVIARIARRSLATDENGGDFTESMEAILFFATAGEQGRTWGIVESVSDPEWRDPGWSQWPSDQDEIRGASPLYTRDDPLA